MVDQNLSLKFVYCSIIIDRRCQSMLSIVRQVSICVLRVTSDLEMLFVFYFHYDLSNIASGSKSNFIMGKFSKDQYGQFFDL